MNKKISFLYDNQSLANILASIKAEINQFPNDIYHDYPQSTFKSMSNLLSYHVLKQWREEDLNRILLHEGFSTIQSIHPHISYSLAKILSHLTGYADEGEFTPFEALQLKKSRTEKMFGKSTNSIMVTLDSKIIKNKSLMKQLLLNGMDIARINCAHDSPEIWRQIVKAIRNSEEEIGRATPQCKIHMELAGPKIRVQHFYSSNEIKDAHVRAKEFFEVSVGDYVTILMKEEELKYLTGHKNIISINYTEALINARIKDKVYINDGKVIGEIGFINDEWLQIKILKTNGEKGKISKGDGINLPDSLVHFILPSLTNEDLKNLPVVYEIADIIGVSFVHHPRDLEKLRYQMQKYPPKDISIITKIETKEAVHYLSKIIVEGLHFDSFGIMIARGDLAVEIGFNELAFVQEEILNVCEAAHIPVVWATGVFERHTKKGFSVRTEVTDAYMGLRADCLMLNKGEFLADAVKNLSNFICLNEERISQARAGKSNFIQYGF